MRNIALSFIELYENRSKFIILFIQITIALIVFSFTFGMFSNARRVEEVCNKINGSNLYILKDVTSQEYFENEILRGEKEIVKRNLDTFLSRMMDSNKYSAFTIINSVTKNNEKLLYISEKYNHVFPMRLLKGEYFGSSLEESSYTPVIVGYKFRDVYKLGQIIYDKYKIIGILKKGNYYLELKSFGAVVSLDESLVMPVNDAFLVDIPEYDLVINRTFIYSDSEEYIEEIANYSSQLNLFEFEYISYNDQKEKVLKDVQEIASLLSMVFMLIAVFSIINIIASLLNYINNKAREHTIHILCGATVYDLAIRLAVQVLFVIILSNLIVVIIIRENYLLEPSIITSVIIILVIIIIPVIKLLNIKIHRVISMED